MKSHPIQTPESQKAIIEKFREQLAHQWAVGASYGAKAFSQVIRDKIDNFKDDDKSALIEDISNFVNVTLQNDPQQLITAFEESQKKAMSIIKGRK